MNNESMDNSKRARFRKKWPFLLLLIPVAVFGFGMAVMLLWNNILPEVTGLHPITFWQALGLLVLCRILFGGFGGGRGKQHCGRGPAKDKWHKLSEEEREQMKEEWKKKLNQ